ncbi:MAG: hypothetical protein CO042_03880 [Parcubacteria group bacterium CG_4_9_14_0_2_um_filter_41_8]|nr:MAG: hypothetical protein AUJ34_02575 [Parcubacteria group bacterium CG1_02_41_12]PJC40425.1 MAG: hypothetical protein CO042_03880 [Parcubacteria group bacterium CG_4_9_14_0_2_um_filter_41_8]
MWFPNALLIKHILLSENVSVVGKIAFLWHSLGYFTENFTWYSQMIVVFVSVLSGINVAMLLFYLKRKISQDRVAGIGLLGTVVGMFGFGCLACNSVILSSVIGISATAGFVGILPFGGSEIGVIGIILLVISIALVSRKISNPSACKINSK